MAKSSDNIEADYRDAMDRAKRWEETDPEKARQYERDAADARSTAYRDRADEADAKTRTAELASAKGEIQRKYPRADPSVITGDSVEAMEAAAKRSHEFVASQIAAEAEATRGARRAEARTAWTGSDRGTRPGLPGGELTQPTPIAAELAKAAWTRTAEVIEQAKLPGHLRRYSEDNTQAVPAAGDPEMAAWQDYKRLHGNSGLTFEGFQRRNAGSGTFVEQDNAGVAADEDRRG